MKHLAAIDGGTYYHHRSLYEAPFGHFFDEVVYVRDVPFRDLSAIATLIVPCRLNAFLLAPLSEQLLAFMEAGGTLVAMGETFQDRWLPGIRLTPTETNFWWWLEEGADLGLQLPRPEHPLFRHLDRAGLAWHLHGHFTTNPNQISLVDTREGGSVLFEDVTSHAPGRLIATTLDPFYHHGSHFMPATTRFLQGFLPWIREGLDPRIAREIAQPGDAS